MMIISGRYAQSEEIKMLCQSAVWLADIMSYLLSME